MKKLVLNMNMQIQEFELGGGGGRQWHEGPIPNNTAEGDVLERCGGAAKIPLC